MGLNPEKTTNFTNQSKPRTEGGKQSGICISARNYEQHGQASQPRANPEH